MYRLSTHGSTPMTLTGDELLWQRARHCYNSRSYWRRRHERWSWRLIVSVIFSQSLSVVDDRNFSYDRRRTCGAKVQQHADTWLQWGSGYQRLQVSAKTTHVYYESRWQAASECISHTRHVWQKYTKNGVLYSHGCMTQSTLCNNNGI